MTWPILGATFSEKARAYYDLERLWRDAKPLEWTAG
jgi:ribosomal silencing factor RsfS